MRTLDKPFGFLVLKPSGVFSSRNYLVNLGYMAGIRIRFRFISVMYSCLAGVVASRAQSRFGIFAVGLQMTIKLNRVKSS